MRLTLPLALLLTAALPACTPALGAEAASPAAPGVHVTANLHGEYLTGSAWLVTLTVRNDGPTTASFPDLGQRPHLVRFVLDGVKGRTERYTTPPATDPGATWELLPRAERRVTLEIPSSAGLAPGRWKLTVRVADPAGPFELPPQDLIAAAPNPAGGHPVWEATVASKVGAMLPWVHKATQGYDLYLAAAAPKHPERFVAQYHLLHLDGPADPVLTVARPTDAQSRTLYWLADDHSVTAVRLDGQLLSGPPRTIGLPYPKVELLGRGGTDAHGGWMAPLWIPNPTGPSGEVRVLSVSERGEQVLRPVGPFPARPAAVATAATSGGELLLALGDASGIALYTVDPAAPAELPARGARVWRTEGGWSPTALAFDVLPDSTTHAGGLSLLSVLTRAEGTGSVARSLWSDLAGKVFLDAPSGPWTAPGRCIDLLPDGYTGWYALTQDDAGARWYTPAGGTASAVKGTAPMTLWATDTAILTRALGGAGIITDTTVGTRSRP